jgi:plasmid rolling circle replication initiator protein Rep
MCDYNRENLKPQRHPEADGRILADVKTNGRERPWRGKKMASLVMSEVYKRLNNQGKFQRMNQCANHLIFKNHENGERNLHSALFCQIPLCPICAMRRSEKIFSQVKTIMDYMDGHNEHKDLKYIFVTLTVKNVTGEELTPTLDKLLKGFKLFVHRKEFRKLSVGWFRALEITHSWERDDYHPHIHLIVAVKKNYFNDYENYLDHDGWMKLWRDCLGLDYDPWVDVRKVKSKDALKEQGTVKLGSVVAEVAKYTVKDEDYLIQWVDVGGGKKVHISKLKDKEKVEELYEKMMSVVSVLDPALHRRRLVAFGGLLKQLHKELNLDDPTEGDLIKIGDEEKNRGPYEIHVYAWAHGVGNYRLVKIDKPPPPKFADMENFGP